MRCVLAALLVLTWACSKPAVHHPLADPHIAGEIAAIKAIDNHAHVASVAAGDHDFDALPVENLEPGSMPTRLTDPKAPEQVQAHTALFGNRSKADLQKEKGDSYPQWVLDQAGIDTVLANRVRMSPELKAPRFRWISYVDALLFPLNNTSMWKDSDKAAFFKLEEGHLKRYLADVGMTSPPASLEDYTAKVITATLERQKQAGALGVKFEAAYLRPLDFASASKEEAARVFAKYRDAVAPAVEYKILQDYLFGYIAKEAGRLDLVVHIHTGQGGGGYFYTTGSNPMLLEPALNDPANRKTKFVLLHGGWPFDKAVGALIAKPNVYADVSVQGLLFFPATLAKHLREWIEFAPDKILFGTDAYPWSDSLGWEESLLMSATTVRQALSIVLTDLWKEGAMTHSQVTKTAHMILRDNARALYKLP